MTPSYFIIDDPLNEINVQEFTNSYLRPAAERMAEETERKLLEWYGDGLYSLPRDRNRLLADFSRWEYERSTAFKFRQYRSSGLSALDAYRRARNERLKEEER